MGNGSKTSASMSLIIVSQNYRPTLIRSYNSLNTNDQDALDSAVGGNFLDKVPRDGLAIIESKSKELFPSQTGTNPSDKLMLSPQERPIPSKLPYPERIKVRDDKPSAQHSRFLKMFKQLRLEIGLKDALVEMPKFNKWLSSLLRNKEKTRGDRHHNIPECRMFQPSHEQKFRSSSKIRKISYPMCFKRLDDYALADAGASRH
ncbi:hypothetical protein Tco_0105828 [Tanacetum coccineum]|uniref:Uncharacterized protein n=1 Tax=Tanacetum coccineum TaxID=301880 RepID=A0ABQ5GVE3_9ASTR